MKYDLNLFPAFLALMEEESAGGHPAAEALAAYRGGELDSEEQARVHRHLAACRECAELAGDLDLFTEATSSAEEDNDFEVAAFLRALKPQLTAARSVPKTSRSSPSRRRAVAPSPRDRGRATGPSIPPVSANRPLE